MFNSVVQVQIGAALAGIISMLLAAIVCCTSACLCRRRILPVKERLRATPPQPRRQAPRIHSAQRVIRPISEPVYL